MIASTLADELAMRVLIVEDHEETRDILRRVLSDMGHEVLGADGLGEARILAAADQPELVMSRIGLSDGNGCDLLLALRKRQPSLRAVAITGCVRGTDEVRCRAAGYRWFLSKTGGSARIMALIAAAAEPDRADMSSVNRE